ncbi:hypothetical protein BDR05DRAFT_946938 [Suillus weaverae]|nr:hypothetical protein BDR05DRAFT_946938 [Suillus weaverae]
MKKIKMNSQNEATKLLDFWYNRQQIYQDVMFEFHANDEFCWLVTRSTKLKVGDPAAKALAHEIASTLATALAQHGSTATSLPPLLLSCAAEIRANCSLNGRLKTLPDWNIILDDDPRIHLHPLFQKTVGYQYPQSPATPPAVPTTPPAHMTPSTSPAPMTPLTLPTPEMSQQQVAALLLPALPPSTPTKPHRLFVVGNGPKCKAPEPEPEVVEALAPKKCKMCQSLHKAGRAPPRVMNRALQSKVKVKLKEFISNDEDVPTNKVTHIKAKSLDAEDMNSSAKDNDSDDECSTARLFGVQCKRCIKDDVACTIVLGKKQGEVHKCCLNCDAKKTKCVRLNPDQEQFLHAALALKKAKSATAAEKKSRNSTQRKAKASSPQAKSRTQSKAPVSTHSTCAASRIWLPTVPSDDLGNEDVQGRDDPEPTAATATATHPPKAVVPAPVAADETEGDKDLALGNRRINRPCQHNCSHPPVDNDVEMEFPANDTTPDVATDAWPDLEAMHTEFASLLTTSGDCVEAYREVMDTQVDAMEEHWLNRFAAMEERIRAVELQAVNNTVSLGHMANTMTKIKNPKIASFDPPAGSSEQGHPFGQLPVSWLHQLVHQPDTGVETRAFTGTSPHPQDKSCASVHHRISTSVALLSSVQHCKHRLTLHIVHALGLGPGSNFPHFIPTVNLLPSD